MNEIAFHLSGCSCSACQNNTNLTDGSNPDISGATKPVATAEEFADYLINGFWSDVGSISRYWSSNSITYSISDEFSNSNADGIRSAFSLWSDTINLQFTEVEADADITIQEGDDGGAWSGSAVYTDGSIAYNIISIDVNTFSWNDLSTVGGYGLLTAIHEIGHSIGLGHSGYYNGSASFNTDAIWANDTRQFSVMSYFNAGYSGADHRSSDGLQYSATPMLYDILAGQLIYGANYETRSNDTIYGFNSNTGQDQFDFSITADPVIALWDGGGVDTLDTSGYSMNQEISIEQGVFSNIGGMTGNVVIAFGAEIENVVGGAGGDTIYGNSLDNIILSGSGSDTIFGSSGNDQIDGQRGIDYINYNFTVDSVAFNFLDSISLELTHITEGFIDLISNIEHFIFADIAYSFQALYDLFGPTDGNDDPLPTEDPTPPPPSNYNEIYGTNQDDSPLSGTDQDDIIYGLGGRDDLYGLDGNDILYGGDGGRDRLYGGNGDDVLVADQGRDILRGDSGSDIFRLDSSTLDNNTDILRDFDLSENDRLDLSEILSLNASELNSVNDYIKISQDSRHSYLSFDSDGLDNGSNFIQLMKITNTLGLGSAQELFNSSILILENEPITADPDQPVNSAPEAVTDRFAFDEDTILSGNVLNDNGGGVDYDPDGDAISVVNQSLITAQGGIVEILSSGVFSYTPSLNYYGSDSFTYTLEDPYGAKSQGAVELTINPINDSPISADDLFNILQDTVLNGNLIIDNGFGVDTDPDGDSILVQETSFITSLGGIVTIYNNGDFIYTPEIGFSGTDQFNYSLLDGQGLYDTGTVNINISAISPPPPTNYNEIYGTNQDDSPLSGTNENDIIYGLDGRDDLYGLDGDDILYGGDGGRDRLYGGNGNDTLVGDYGRDILRGDGGADSFSWMLESIGSGVDIIRDFDSQEGDTLNISDILDLDGLSNDLTNYVQITEDSRHSYLNIDNQGTSNFVTIAKITNTTGLTNVEDLYNNGILVV
jgi:Ca2+-binding RTX toxin-like protein